MCKNESGFTFLEGMLSLSFMILLSITLFPLLFNMLHQLNEEKKELTAYRLLYEHMEKQIKWKEGGRESRTIRNIDYELTLKEGREGDWIACVYYEEREHCLQQ
ncbi:hypothetical protein [Lederbergia lenta]|uniref:hypothetical protein n=1 Tax=Lederbergia lenta TaxID=1467 RepID=UPI00203F523C|nr:hypothetical protein [Lederbergia lenta]MCM3111447.1 hypothetical protein [Lederbergia lenta]